MSQSQISRRSMLVAIVSAGALSMASPSCAAVETSVSAEPGASFTLTPGQTAAVRGTDTRITFKQVREDSRCPVDVTCVWAGDARIEIVVSRNGAADETRILSITKPSEIQVGNLRIRLVSLAPVPRQADANVPRKYRAEFVAERL